MGLEIKDSGFHKLSSLFHTPICLLLSPNFGWNKCTFAELVQKRIKTLNHEKKETLLCNRTLKKTVKYLTRVKCFKKTTPKKVSVKIL